MIWFQGAAAYLRHNCCIQRSRPAGPHEYLSQTRRLRCKSRPVLHGKDPNLHKPAGLCYRATLQRQQAAVEELAKDEVLIAKRAEELAAESGSSALDEMQAGPSLQPVLASLQPVLARLQPVPR
jgi:hypothetical protein